MKAFLLLSMALMSSIQVMAGNGVESLDCASKCWDNSKFVSSCTNEAKCLCEDSEFQSAVFQCLYSQCQTAQFGIAVHSALLECSGIDVEAHAVLPHLIRHQKFRNRRNIYSGSGSVLATTLASGYASASRTYSATFRHATQAASGYWRSRSASSGHTFVHSRFAPEAFTTTSFASLPPSQSMSAKASSATLLPDLRDT